MGDITSRADGSLSESYCIYAFLKNGFSVFNPHRNNSVHDFIVSSCNDASRVFRIQVKTAMYEEGGDRYRASLTHRFGRSCHYTKEEVDFFLIFIPEYECVYVVPNDKVRKSFKCTPHKDKKSINDVYKNNFSLIK